MRSEKDAARGAEARAETAGASVEADERRGEGAKSETVRDDSAKPETVRTGAAAVPAAMSPVPAAGASGAAAAASPAAVISVTGELVFPLLPVRAPESHKGDFGRVLCVCGCAQYRGAAALCCLGALRAGAGLVTLAAPEVVAQSVAARILEAMFLPLESAADTGPALEAAARRATVCAAGCGRAPDADTARQMAFLLRTVPGTVVLDAGGLVSLAGQPQALAAAAGRLIVTPHPGEMAALLGVPLAEVLADGAGAARALAQKTGAVTLLKGHRTLIAAPDGRLWRNTTGCAGLARGGSGDVLTGIIAGLAACGLSPADAAVCGVWLHGAAADRCAARLSMQAMLPEDILADMGALFLEKERAL